tara:strand:- start:216 stop:1103 length:888 start_codon:yes stop_codon:yes gene_type:complete
VDTSKELKYNRPLNVISFCSGYGGIERGLDLAGTDHRVLAYVEIEAYAIANLVNKMESGQLDAAPIYTDLKTFPAHLFRDCVDLITGGYPCQPFSAAGRRKGEEDPRHLWPYIRKHINAIRPTQCFFENVEGHISLGLSSVLSDMEEDGYSTTWGVFSAAEVGAPHQRKRVYILSNTISHPIRNKSERKESGWVNLQASRKAQFRVDGEAQRMADTTGIGVQRLRSGRKQESDTYGETQLPVREGQRSTQTNWLPEPNVGRVVDGCADRVDRIRLLGNGVVPQTSARAWEVLNAR